MENVIRFRNEFAYVTLSKEVIGNRERLLITDVETGNFTYVDPLELASLCTWPEERRLEIVRSDIYEESR